jgi:hypothetical protein
VDTDSLARAGADREPFPHRDGALWDVENEIVPKPPLWTVSEPSMPVWFAITLFVAQLGAVNTPIRRRRRTVRSTIVTAVQDEALVRRTSRACSWLSANVALRLRGIRLFASIVTPETRRRRRARGQDPAVDGDVRQFEDREAAHVKRGSVDADRNVGRRREHGTEGGELDVAVADQLRRVVYVPPAKRSCRESGPKRRTRV